MTKPGSDVLGIGPGAEQRADMAVQRGAIAFKQMLDECGMFGIAAH
jgi:hypothetical protein